MNMRRLFLTVLLIIGLATFVAAQAAPATAADVKVEAGPIPQNLTPTSVRIWWVTDKPSETIVRYGTSPAMDQTAPQQAAGQTNHSVDISGLQPGTHYYYEVAYPNGQARASGQFDTPTQASAGNVHITNGPVIEHIDQNTAILAWSTNVPSSSIVRYGTNPQSLTQTAQAAWGEGGSGGAHRVHLQGLQPNTRYWFRVESTQAQGTGSQVEAAGGQFMTLAPGQPVFTNTQAR
jgi:phosphodiesterase/alkaline phosphatase D-like protein